MKKIYVFMLLLFAVMQLPAQILVQGRPHPTAVQQVSPRAIADGTFTMEMIENWTGEGANRAALAVQWNVDGEESALVWGFRWDGEATGATMITAIAAADPRFVIASESGTAFGSTVSGLGYDVNKSGDFAIVKDGEVRQANELGLIPMSGYSYDGWSCTDPEDYWQSGWYQGYWSYWTKSADSDSWYYSNMGISGRKLTDGCWDGWNFSAGMQSYDWKPLAAAAKNGLTEPSIKSQPESLVVSPGEPAAFVPVFRGDSLTYQWYKDKVAIEGAVKAVYSIASATTADAGSYYCVAGNRLGSVSTDPVTLTVGEKAVVAIPGEAPHTAVIMYDDSYATFSGSLTIPATVELDGQSCTVTAIGDMAFMGCTKLTSIELPATVQTIGEGAFYGCTGLTAVELPESAATIGAEAFGGCTALTTLTTNENLKTLGRSAFAGCTALTAVALPDGLTTIEALAFNGCAKLASASLGHSLTQVGDSAFYGCSALAAVELPATVTRVGDYACYGCSALQSLTLSGQSALREIGKYAFAETAIASVSLPDGVTSLGSHAFSKCASLTTVSLGNGLTTVGDYAFADCKKLTSLTLGNRLTAIGDRAFDSAGLTSLVLPATVQTIGEWSFFNCPLTTLTLNDGLQSIGSRAFYGAAIQTLDIPNSVTMLGTYAFSNCKKLETLTVGNGITKIGDYAFNSCTMLSQIACPSVTEIGASAFKGCSALKSLPLSDRIVTLGASAFSGCTGITELTVPNSITSIGSYAFEKCTALTSATLGTGIAAVPDYAFSGCTALESVVLPANITAIGKYAFQNSGLSQLPLTEQIVEIREYAFKGCAKLTEVDIPDRVTMLGGYVFRECTGLRTARIGGGVTSVPDYAFYGCMVLDSVVLSDRIVEIADYAFYNCRGLKRLPDAPGVTTFGRSAFYGCTGLESARFTDRVTTLGSALFSGCTSLTSIVVPDGVTSLGASAFYGCSALQSAELGTGVKALESNLFKNNTSLTRVVVNGAIASVANYTFGGCSALESLYINSALPSGASSNTFDKVPESCKIYVPAESCGDYAEANYWKAFDIQPWLTQLSIVSTAPEMTLDGGELLEIDGKTTTFAITFNRSLVEADAVTVRLKQGDTELAGQTFSLSSEGAVLTLVREGEELPAGDYTLVLTTSTATLRISFRVATPTGIEGVGADKVVLTREYYSVDGKRLPAPVPGINLVKVVYDDHSVEVLKVFVNTDLRR